MSEGNLKKRRCLAPTSVEFPTSLKLSVKDECGEGDVAIKAKKGSIVGRKSALVSASWSQEDIENMADVILKRLELIKQCGDSLSLVSSERRAVEDKLRRARMLLLDRQLMVSEAQVALTNLRTQEHVLRAEIQQSSQFSTSTGSVEGLMTQLDTLLFKITCNERTSKLSGVEIEDCEGVTFVLEKELDRGLHQEKQISLKVKALEGLVPGMNDQLRVMREGGGATFWPRPLSGSPHLPLIVTHTLNACPVCCLWYSCFDYVPLSCGHCYHPWCLHEYARISSSCMISGCNVDLQGPHGVALGLRPIAKVNTTTLPKAGKLVVTADAKKLHVSTSTSDDTQRTVDMDVAISQVTQSMGDGVIEENLLSQSSKTIVIPTHGAVHDYGAKPQKEITCWSCDTRPASVVLQKCGHSFFCFECIQGKKDCPFCFEEISGWSPLPRTRKPISQLSLAGRDRKTTIEAVASSGIKKRKLQQSIEVEPAVLPCSPSPTKDNEEYYGSDSDILDGTHHWCGDNEFRKGGLRSISPVAVEAQPCSPPTLSFNASLKGLKSCEEDPSEYVDVPCGMKVFSRSKNTRTDIETLNHTRIVSKPLTELLGPVSAPNGVNKVGRGVAVRSGVLPRQRECILVATKPSVSTVQKEHPGTRPRNGRVKVAPARLKDL